MLPPCPHTNPVWEMPPPSCVVDKGDSTTTKTTDKQNNNKAGKTAYKQLSKPSLKCPDTGLSCLSVN